MIGLNFLLAFRETEKAIRLKFEVLNSVQKHRQNLRRNLGHKRCTNTMSMPNAKKWDQTS